MCIRDRSIRYTTNIIPINVYYGWWVGYRQIPPLTYKWSKCLTLNLFHIMLFIGNTKFNVEEINQYITFNSLGFLTPVLI